MPQTLGKIMSTEEQTLREMRLAELQDRITSRRFGFRAMKRTLLFTIGLGLFVAWSSIPYDGFVVFGVIVIILFTFIDEFDTHMKTHLGDVMELMRLMNRNHDEK